MKSMVIMFCFLLVTQDLHAQQISYNQEFKIHSFVSGNQLRPSVTELKNGTILICWMSDGQKSSYGIYGQLFDQNFQRLNYEFEIKQSSEGISHLCPVPVYLRDGGFIIFWISREGSSYLDNCKYEILGQRYNENCMKIGDEIILSFFEKSQFRAWLKAINLSDGRSIVCWQGGLNGAGFGNIYGQYFDSLGEKDGEPIIINIRKQSVPDEDLDLKPTADGGFVSCWQNHGDGSCLGIFFQIIDSVGIKYDLDIQANTYTFSEQTSPSIAVLKSQSIIVSWKGNPHDGSSWDKEIYAQMFNKEGDKVGGEFQVNSYSNSNQFWPSSVGLKNGNFIICWYSWEQDNSFWGVFGKMFNEEGNEFAPDFQINDYYNNHQYCPNANLLKDGRVLIMWHSKGQDGSGVGVYGKYYLEEPILHELAEFSLISPRIDATIKSTNPTLTWQKATKTRICYSWEVLYDLYISDLDTTRLIDNIRDTTYTINGLAPGKTYLWWVVAKNINDETLLCAQKMDWGFFIDPNVTDVESNENDVHQKRMCIMQNYPNPFNSSTDIKYFIPASERDSRVVIKIYDVLGRLIRVLIEEQKKHGTYIVNWDGTDEVGNMVSSGVYFYTLEVSESKLMKKMLLLQ
ncbi:T9SS type A sorting domain-containing protein [candidate division KSB1 bacterium]|nr:T9SS type A sorting domain-containing protein [candidate division KSB1 bacterium]